MSCLYLILRSKEIVKNILITLKVSQFMPMYVPKKLLAEFAFSQINYPVELKVILCLILKTLLFVLLLKVVVSTKFFYQLHILVLQFSTLKHTDSFFKVDSMNLAFTKNSFKILFLLQTALCVVFNIFDIYHFMRHAPMFFQKFVHVWYSFINFVAAGIKSLFCLPFPVTASC